MTTPTPRALAEAEARRAREAAALRENLRRRKAQLRTREIKTDDVPTVIISDDRRLTADD